MKLRAPFDLDTVTTLSELHHQWHASAVATALNESRNSARWLIVELTRPEPNPDAINAMSGRTKGDILSYWYLREGCPTFDDVPNTYPYTQTSDRHFMWFCDAHRPQLDGMSPSELARFAGADQP
jgi:hypothetical protein